MKTFSSPGFLLYLLILCMLNSCKTIKPTSDDTPPVITKWQVTNQITNETQDFTGSQNKMKVIRGKEYVITCFAVDEQGIQSVTVGAEGKHACWHREGSAVYSDGYKYAVWYSNETVTEKPDQNNKVPTLLIYSKKFIIKENYPCDNNMIPFVAEAKNYGSQSVKSSLELDITE